MTSNPPVTHELFDELYTLVAASFSGDITAIERRRLEELVQQNEEVCNLYLKLVFESSTLLAWAGHSELDSTPNAEPTTPTLLFTVLHTPFSYLSSNWLTAYLVATVILAIGALIGSVVYVSHPGHVAQQSISRSSPLSHLPTTVGRITAMVECRWESSGVRGQRARTGNPRSPVSLGDKFALAAGLMEITYDTGVKVILQGPVTYEVESSNGGFLSVGKLTARVEKRAEGGGRKAEEVAGGQWSVAGKSEIKNMKSEMMDSPPSSNPQSLIPNPSSLSTLHSPLFTIKTPTAAVTDLGTEFGVEVSESGVTETDVFVGAVQVVRIGGKDVADRGITVVRAGQFARVAASKESPVSVGQRQPDAMATRFARAIPKNVSAADDYAKLVLSMRPFAYYRMERPAAGQDRNVILDSAPDGHHGTLHFAEGYNSEPWRPGRFGDSFAPRGEFAGDYVDFQDFPSTDTNQLSVSTWVYYGPRSADAVIAGGMMPAPVLSTHCDGWQFYCEVAGDYLLAAVNDRNVNHVHIRAPTPLPKGQWQHVAMVADGSVLHLYCNGVEVGQVPCDGVAPTPPLKHFTIGGIWNWPAAASVAEAKPCSFWSGRIDEFAMFHRALSAQQVQQLFEGGPHKPTPGAPETDAQKGGATP
jgi:hypothetical protein